jgi:hypothetical protein
MGFQASCLTNKPERERRWKRHKLDLPVRLLLVRPEKTSVVPGRGTDVNDGGMAIFAGAEIRVDREVFIEFTQPFANELLRVRGVVRNRNGYIYGVEFASDKPEEKQMTDRFRQLLRMVAGNA